MSQQPIVETTSESVSPRPQVRRRKRLGPKWLHKLLKRWNLRQNLSKLIAVLVVFVVVVVVVGAVIVSSTVSQVQSAIQNLNRVIGSITTQNSRALTLDDFNRLGSSLQELVSTFDSAYSQGVTFQPLLMGDADLRANLIEIGAGAQLGRAAQSIMIGMQPVVHFLLGEEFDDPLVVQISTGERIVELLSIGRPRFIQAAQNLARAREMMQGIDVNTISSSVLLQLEQLRTYEELLSRFQTVLVDSPDLLASALGIGGQASYLVLAANSDELRPSGGYISTYGWILVRNGRIEGYNYSATSTTSPNPPPDTITNPYPTPDWWIRYREPIYAAWDGSWSPDFPTTAEMAMWYYNAGSNPQSPLDGVISIDIVAFEYILEALGQVVIPEYGLVVTPENFRNVVYTIRAESVDEGTREHKAFLAAVYRQIFDDWQARITDPTFSSEILGVLLRALQERHLMLYTSNPAINQALDVIGWSGAQTPTQGDDYLMVVDSNLGNKSNSSIRRQLIYDVELTAGGSAFNRTTVLYDYSASVAEFDAAVDERYHGQLDYVNLLQVYVPSGSTLDITEGSLFNPRVVATDEMTQFISQLVVDYNSSQRYQFSYAVPGVVHPLGAFQQYNLLIQKQPGMRAELVIVQITLPSGTSLVQASPTPGAIYSIDQQILEFRIDFRSDVNISIVYETY